jgi:hypothetical protein
MQICEIIGCSGMAKYGSTCSLPCGKIYQSGDLTKRKSFVMKQTKSISKPTLLDVQENTPKFLANEGNICEKEQTEAYRKIHYEIVRFINVNEDYRASYFKKNILISFEILTLSNTERAINKIKSIYSQAFLHKMLDVVLSDKRSGKL